MYNERVETRVFKMPSQAITVLRALEYLFVILVLTMENTQANSITVIHFIHKAYSQQHHSFNRLTGVFQCVDQVL